MRSRLNSKIVFNIEIEVEFRNLFLIFKCRLDSRIVSNIEIEIKFKNSFPLPAVSISNSDLENPKK